MYLDEVKIYRYNKTHTLFDSSAHHERGKNQKFYPQVWWPHERLVHVVWVQDQIVFGVDFRIIAPSTTPTCMRTWIPSSLATINLISFYLLRSTVALVLWCIFNIVCLAARTAAPSHLLIYLLIAINWGIMNKNTNGINNTSESIRRWDELVLASSSLLCCYCFPPSDVHNFSWRTT